MQESDRNDYRKLTVIGDIMCEPPVFRQAERADGTYDFMPAFEHLKPMLADADYAAGNLETPIAGKELGYTVRLVSFNAPVELARTVQALGIRLVSTANNHACDRGSTGIRETLRNLDSIGLDHTGTFVGYRPDAPERIFYHQLGDTKLAFIACTYGTNYGINHAEPDEANGDHINYLRPCKTKAGVGTRSQPKEYRAVLKLIDEARGEKHIWEDEVNVRNALGISQAYADDVLVPEECEPFLAQIERDCREARQNADLVFLLPHMGGQFNTVPGAFSSYMMYRFVKMGFDGIFAAHSHTLQRACFAQGGVPCFYSMGNVSMAPFSAYAARETLPEYALAAHLYLKAGKIEKTTFSLTKIIENDDGRITVYPVDALYQRYLDLGSETVTKPGHPASDNIRVQGAAAAELLKNEAAEIYTRVTGRAFPGIRAEYEL